MRGTIVLSHGLESGPQATKVSALAEVAEKLGWASVRPDYRDVDVRRDPEAIDARITRCVENAPVGARVVFAGSSMGAFVSGFASLKHETCGLFLLALPVSIESYPRVFEAAAVPTTLVHGWDDDLCPVDAVIDFARRRGDTLHLVDDGHRLAEHVAFCCEAFRQFLRALD